MQPNLGTLNLVHSLNFFLDSVTLTSLSFGLSKQKLIQKNLPLKERTSWMNSSLPNENLIPSPSISPSNNFRRTSTGLKSVVLGIEPPTFLSGTLSPREGKWVSRSGCSLCCLPLCILSGDPWGDQPWLMKGEPLDSWLVKMTSWCKSQWRRCFHVYGELWNKSTMLR